MPCYSPLTAWLDYGHLTKSGKPSVVFRGSNDPLYKPKTVPCGQCIGCRLEYSRKWAIRCTHEASLYDRNCFITLTYDDRSVMYDQNLHLDHLQKFFKRLRKKFGEGIRYFACGEYGSKNGRPHYHALIFNFDFNDKKLWQVNKNGTKYFVSDALSKLWTAGFSTTGAVTFESAAYVARYTLKKASGNVKNDRSSHCRPEFLVMSRRPGVGKGWIEKYVDEVYPLDRVIVRGRECKPPRYYDSYYESLSGDDYQLLKISRELRKKDGPVDYARLSVSQIIKEYQISNLVRPLEYD